MPLQIASFTGPRGVLIADWSDVARNVEFSTNEHGYSSLTAFIPLMPVAAFYWFDRPGLPWIEVWGDGELAWKGRIEDVRLVSGGISLSALGAWSTFGDVPYSDTPGTVHSNVIVGDVLAAARVDNPTLLSASTALIQDPGVSVHDEDYTDADMRQILTRMATLGDSMTPPRQWEVGIWRNNQLHFRPRGTDARAWYVDAADPEIERSLSRVWNSVYTRYNSGASTTSTANDTPSIVRYGATRRRAVSSRTSDGGQADRERDAALADGATPIPRASVAIDTIYTATGSQAPLWMVRSGDTLTLRNLPPEAGDIIDRIRTFRIAETRFSCETNRLTITPEAPLPLLDNLVARSLEVAT